MAPAVAHAQLGTPGTPASFQIDGQLFSGPNGDDWAQGSSFNGIFLGPSRTPSILPSVSFRDPNWAGNASDATSFAGSSNKNNDYIGATQSPWTTSPGSGPQKNDFTDIYVTSRVEFVPGPPATTNVWLIVGGTTRAVNGDSHVDFEFNRAGITLVPNKPDHLVGNGPFGGRSIGDIILSVDYGTGGTNPSISIRRWQAVVPATNPPSYSYVDVTPASAGTHFMVVDNTGAPTGPWGGVAPDGSLIPAGSNMVALQFFEGAVNLTAAGIVPADLCSGLSTMMVKSRSSTSFTAELKDYGLVPFQIVTSPTCSISGPGALCSGTTGSTYSVTTNASNPSYLWSITGNGTISGPATGSSVVVNAGAAGSFTLAVDIQSGAGGVCGTSCNKSVTVNPNPTVTVAPVTICASAVPATLTAVGASGTAPYTFSWSGPGGFTGTGSSISASTAGTYNVTVTDFNGCAGTGSGVLTLNPNPTVTVAPVTVCASALPASLTAVGSGGTGPYTFSWSGPGGFTGTGSSISVSTAGTYNVTVTDASSTHCTGTGSGTLTVNSGPTVTVAPVAVCASALPASLTAVGSGGTAPYTFSWSGPGGFTGTGSSISVSTAGTYNVTVTDASSTHCTGTGSGDLTVNPNPTVTVPPVTVCANAVPVTMTASASGGTPPYSFSWSGPGGFTATGNPISVSTAGTYNVTVTDASGTQCPGAGSGTLTLNPNPVVTATGDVLTCIKTCGQLTASSTPPGLTYSWTGPGGFTSSQQNPAVCDSGTYTVTVTTSQGCTGTATAHVSITIPVIAPCGSGGPITAGFELDGDAFAVSPNPPDDWDLVYGGTSGATTTTGVVNDFPSKADDYFQVGTKDQDDVPAWHYNVQSTPDKDDILHGGAAQYGGLLYFFGDRYDNSGDAQIGFWFLKDTVDVIVPGSTFTGHHQVGDLLVLSNFTNGGTNPVIFAYEWVGSGGSDGSLNKLTLNASNSFAIVNSTSKPSPWPFQAKGKPAANTFPAGTFFEGGLDLGCLTGAGVSACFSNFILETRSSASVTASLKDFLIGHFTVGSTSVATVLKRGEASFEATAPAAGALPIEFALKQPVPNPFRGSTVIGYALPEASSVSLRVFNVQGQQVATLVSGTMNRGYHSIDWNGRDRAGRPVGSGIYFYRLEATGVQTGTHHEQLRKMLLLK
jgi:hypothetical protein